MRNFKSEDFQGAGQYLVKANPDKKYIADTSYLTTVMVKVGWITPNTSYLTTVMVKVGWITPNQKAFVFTPEKGNIYTLTDMSDGMTSIGYWDTREDPDRNKNPRMLNTETWVWKQFNNKQDLCDYLNNPDLCRDEFRPATHEELMRFILHQRNRCEL